MFSDILFNCSNLSLLTISQIFRFSVNSVSSVNSVL